jgi:NitT/TauT family transport system ATP-binding protein
MLAGFVRPANGRCLMRGERIERPARDRVVIFQGDDSLFHWLTVDENIAFPLRVQRLGRRERERRIAWGLELTGLSSHRTKYPKELSGGMKQRLQLARALVSDTELLLMDEPFGALDALTRSDLQAQLVDIWSETKKTIFFITHDIAEAVTLGSRIGVMSHGPRATLEQLLDVRLPRPRSHADPEFGRLYEEIRSSLGRRRTDDRTSQHANETAPTSTGLEWTDMGGDEIGVKIGA